MIKAENSVVKEIYDFSTVGPMVSKELGKEGEVKGYKYYDCPIAGGVAGAEAATLSIMIGCADEEFEKVKEVVSPMGKHIMHAGTVGSGSIYIEAAETSGFWDELQAIRSKTDAKIMWEIPTSAAMTESRHQKVIECIKKADIYSVNYPEAKCLFQIETEEEAVQKIIELGIPCFFRTGSRGSYMLDGKEAAFAKSLTVGEVIDRSAAWRLAWS